MGHIAGHISWQQAPAPSWVAYAHQAPASSPAHAPTIHDAQAELSATAPTSLYDARHGLLIAANARIDDRAALWAKLREAHNPAAPPPLLEILRRAYMRWESSLGAHVLGDYAIAIWDAPRQQLTLIRDAIGIRPLYYTSTQQNGIAFASTVRALLTHPQVQPQVNETAVARFLHRASTGGIDTFFRGIRTVPPAHALVATPNGSSCQRYWKPDATAHLRPNDDIASARGLRAVLSQAVHDRMGPATGAAVSGGLDSSSIACLAHHQQPNGAPFPIFSATFPNLPAADLRQSDERHYLHHLSRTGHFDVHELPVDHLNPAEEIDDAVRLLGAPPHICNLYLQRHLHRAARSAGCTVVLDGSEGDVAISHGFGWLAELAATGQWTRFISEVRALVDRIGGAKAPDLFWTFGAPYLREQIRTQPAQALRAAHQLHRALHLSRRDLWTQCIRGVDNAPSESSLLRSEWIRRLPTEPEVPLPRTEREAHAQSIHAFDASSAVVMAEINQVAAADGIERRHPFYDRRVLEYCLSLPPTQKLRHGWTRWVLRTAMAPDLPAAIRWRAGKSNLAPTFNRNLLRDTTDRLDAASSHPQLAPYINAEALAHARTSGDATTCWRVLGLMAWFDALPDLAAPVPHASTGPLRQDVTTPVDALLPSSTI